MIRIAKFVSKGKHILGKQKWSPGATNLFTPQSKCSRNGKNRHENLQLFKKFLVDFENQQYN